MRNKMLTRLLSAKSRQARRGPAPIGDEQGFTLIETVLSLSILVIMIGLVLSSLRLGQRSMEKGEQALDDATARRFITKRLSSDVSSMYLYSQNSGGAKTYLFHAGADEFAFVTAHHAGSTALPWGGVAFVRYSTGQKGLIVTEKTLPLADTAKKQDDRVVEMGLDISRVSFRYLGDDGWVKRWDMESEQRLPMAVRAEFFFKAAAREPLVVMVPVWASHAPFEDAPSGSKGV